MPTLAQLQATRDTAGTNVRNNLAALPAQLRAAANEPAQKALCLNHEALERTHRSSDAAVKAAGG